MVSKLNERKQSKAKMLSKWFLATSLLFIAALTFHVEESEAARRTSKRMTTRKVVKKNTIPRASIKGLSKKNPAGVFALYQNPIFGYGKCLPTIDEPAHKILSRNGIRTANAAENERAALAKGIAQVERLLGKPIPKEYRYDYQWIEASGAWNSGLSRVGFVTVKRLRGSPKGTLTGRMIHELGHRFGHANGGENYQEYKQHMRGKKCRITTYTGKSLNEEFAEVFEAYVVHPDFLAKHCPDSYAYFKTKLFRNSNSVLASCEDPNSILEHDTDDDDDAIEDTGEDQIDEKHDFDLDLPKEGPIPVWAPREEAVVQTPPVATVTDDKAAEGSVPVTPPTTITEVIQQDAAQVAPTEYEVVLPDGDKVPIPTPRPQQ